MARRPSPAAFGPPEMLALLAAAGEHPDDTPRLILADYLDEHGDADRAEFIRLQVELARLAPGEGRRADMEGRADDLLRRHAAAWLGPARRFPSCRFERGLLHIRASVAQVRKALASGPQALAWLERWELTEEDTEVAVGDFLMLPELSPVVRLVAGALERSLNELRATGEAQARLPRCNLIRLGLILSTFPEYQERRPSAPVPEVPWLVRTLTGHTDCVRDLAVLPDGDTLVSASEDGTLGVWSLRTGRRLRKLTQHQAAVNCLDLTPDSRTLLTGSDDHTVRVWDTATWTVRRVLCGHGAFIRWVAAGPGGLAASGAEDRLVCVWDVESGRCLHRLTGHEDQVTQVAISPDGHTLCSVSLDNVWIFWDLPGGAERRRMDEGRRIIVHLGGSLFVYAGEPLRDRGHAETPYALAYSPDGRCLISAGDRIIFWGARSGRELRSLPGHGHDIRCMSQLPGGRLATGGNCVKVWNVKDGTSVVFTDPLRDVESLAATPDGRLLAAGLEDGTIHVFRPDVVPPQGHAGRVVRVRVSADGRRGVSAADDGTFRVWDLKRGTLVRSIETHLHDGARPFALTADGGRLVTGGWRGDVRVWDLHTGREQLVLRHEDNAIAALAVTPDGRRAVAVQKWTDASGYDRQWLPLLRWDLKAGASPREFAGMIKQPEQALFTPDGRHVVTVGWFALPDPEADDAADSEEGRSQLQLWDVEQTTLLWTRAAGKGESLFLYAVTPDGRSIVHGIGREADRVQVRDLVGGDVVRELTPPGVVADTPLLLPGGRLLLGSRNGTLRLGVWDLATGALVRETQTGLGDVGGVSFTPDGGRAAVLSEGEVVLWDVAAERILSRFRGSMPLLAAAITPDGATVLAGERGGLVHVFRAE